MLTSTTSRNSNCSCREPMQYFCICFRASLSIHSAGWIFPFSTFITSCFSGHNTLFFLAVSGFRGLHDTIWPFNALTQPTFGTEQTPALRAFVAARGSLRPTRFLLLLLFFAQIHLSNQLILGIGGVKPPHNRPRLRQARLPPASPQKRTQRLTGGNSGGKRDEPRCISRATLYAELVWRSFNFLASVPAHICMVGAGSFVSSRYCAQHSSRLQPSCCLQ